MNPAERNLAAFAVILVGLAGRAGVDKILALRSGPELVALWAQLQSVVDLVAGVTLAGIGPGLTVLIAQAPGHGKNTGLLRSALRLGLATSASAMLLVVVAALAIGRAGDRISSGLMVLAAMVGCVVIVPGLVSAYWLGRHRQDRILLLTVVMTLPLIAAALWSGMEGLLRNLLVVQCALALAIGTALSRALRSEAKTASYPGAEEHAKRQLARYLPVGLAIGILSPASVLAARGILSGALSWGDAGFVQALWRASEWVTGSAAGVLSLLFLPRLSAARGSRDFGPELARSGATVLIPSAALLLLLFLNQKGMLAALYDSKFVVSDAAAALFLLGDWVRIASWVFLYALFAMRRTAMIIAGEILSLPLFALLLHLFSGGMTLERAGLLYLLSYLAYFAFNAAAVLGFLPRYSQRRPRRNLL